MITDLELDRVLASWLADGAERAPAEDVAAALREAGRTRQWPRLVPRIGGVRLGWVVRRWWVWAALLLVGVLGALTTTGGGSVRTIDYLRAAPDLKPDAVAFTAMLPAGAPSGVYWRAATYDTYVLDGWTQTAGASVQVRAGEPLLAGSAEAPPADRTIDLRVTIQTDDYRDAALLSPGIPVSVDTDATVRLTRRSRMVRRRGARAPDGNLHRGRRVAVPGRRARHQRHAAPERRPGIPGRDRRAIHGRPRGGDRPRRRGPPRQHQGAGRHRRPVRPRRCHRRRPRRRPVVHVRHGLVGQRLHEPERRRVLRADGARLLPPVRLDDGDPPAGGQPG